MIPYYISEEKLKSVREQIQEDILSFASVIDDEKIFLTDKVLSAESVKFPELLRFLLIISLIFLW
jgi:hypothetical protein